MTTKSPATTDSSISNPYERPTLVPKDAQEYYSGNSSRADLEQLMGNAIRGDYPIFLLRNSKKSPSGLALMYRTFGRDIRILNFSIYTDQKNNKVYYSLVENPSERGLRQYVSLKECIDAYMRTELLYVKKLDLYVRLGVPFMVINKVRDLKCMFYALRDFRLCDNTSKEEVLIKKGQIVYHINQNGKTSGIFTEGSFYQIELNNYIDNLRKIKYIDNGEHMSPDDRFYNYYWSLNNENDYKELEQNLKAKFPMFVIIKSKKDQNMLESYTILYSKNGKVRNYDITTFFRKNAHPDSKSCQLYTLYDKSGLGNIATADGSFTSIPELVEYYMKNKFNANLQIAKLEGVNAPMPTLTYPEESNKIYLGIPYPLKKRCKKSIIGIAILKRELPVTFVNGSKSNKLSRIVEKGHIFYIIDDRHETNEGYYEVYEHHQYVFIYHKFFDIHTERIIYD